MQPPNAAGVLALERLRWEIVPLKGVEDRIAHLPAGAMVTITSSPAKGIDATLALCETVLESRSDCMVTPHISARLIRDKAHLSELVHRLDGLGIEDIFVVAGDPPEPAGRYESGPALLRELADVGHPFKRIGIPGYPEGHPFISDEDMIRAMDEKAPYSNYIVSQICYDPATIERWIKTVRARGITLPIYLGIPGVVDVARLLRISVRIGLGDSVRFLRKQRGVVARLVTGYTPNDLVKGLTDVVTNPANGVPGWHLCTFNEIQKTEAWRQKVAPQLHRGSG
jgi:methylenetetrahydrofolate reductase (NADPH)